MAGSLGSTDRAVLLHHHARARRGDARLGGRRGVGRVDGDDHSSWEPVPDRANVQQCLHWACDATRYGRLHLGPVEVAGLFVGVRAVRGCAWRRVV